MKDEALLDFTQYFKQMPGEDADISEEQLDKFLEFVTAIRQEKLLDIKFWAFIFAYINMRMKQLQENQKTILHNIVSAYITKTTIHMEEPLSLDTLLVYLTQTPDHLKDFNNFIDIEVLGKNGERAA